MPDCKQSHACFCATIERERAFRLCLCVTQPDNFLNIQPNLFLERF